MNKTKEDTTWVRFRQSRIKEYRKRIKDLEQRIERDTQRLKGNKKLLKSVENLLDSVNPVCDVVTDNYKHLISTDKVRLNAKVAQAVESRGCSHIVGLFQGFTSITYDWNSFEMAKQWWCDRWFNSLLTNIDRSSSTERGEMYNFLEKVKHMQDQKAIEEEFGLFVLKAL